jgi:hypothetical protein
MQDTLMRMRDRRCDKLHHWQCARFDHGD